MRLQIVALVFCFLVSACSAEAQTSSPPSLVLHGSVHSTQNQTYIEASFNVPEGTHRITVAFHNLGRDHHTVIDLGILDPFRFRGASGGNKEQFTLSETDATPSYLPGAIPPGRWKLLLAIPNIRAGVTSGWSADVWFDRPLDDSSFTEQRLRDRPDWYRGDLHVHTAHSDGSCPGQSGKSVPCPLFLTMEAAVRRGLDFIAITDHNTTSQYDDERELQPYFDKLLMIPGRELTTFNGHANVFGTTRFLDYRVGSTEVRDENSLFRKARELGAIVSINHPEAPTGEVCMGCGWTPTHPVDMTLVSSIEVVNGSHVASRFWDGQLRDGHRLTAVGGSDNHHADWPPDRISSIGSPTTVIYAQNLSVAGILAGVRSGRVFIDLTGSRNRLLDMNALAGSLSAAMGSDLETHSGDAIALEVHVVGCEGASVHLLMDGKPQADLPLLPISTSDAMLHATWKSDGRRHYIRAEVRDAGDHLRLLGNPIYLGFTPEL